jgi:spore coat protein H
VGVILASMGAAPTTRPVQPVPKKAGDLYEMTAVWSIHLRFTAEEWEQMQPKQDMFGPGRGQRFTPAMQMTPVFFGQGDADKDGKLTATEMGDLATKWFTAWDKAKAGKLTTEQVRTGLGEAMTSATPPRPSFRLQGPEGKRNGLAAANGVDFDYAKADLVFEGQTFKDVAVRYKGNGTFMQSRMTNKKSLKIDLNEHVKGQKLAGVTKLNLHNCVTDSSWMNEVLSHKLYRDAKVAAPRTAYARVHVTVPGKFDKAFIGLYSMVEAIDDDFAKRQFDAKDGAILKPVTPAPFTDLGDDWALYNQTYDPKDEMTDAQKKRVIEFCKLVSNASDEEFNAKVGQYVDLDNASRYMAVTVWVCTLDSILGLGQNYYVYLHPKTGKLNFIPWDLDHSFGQFPFIGTQEQREKMSIHRPWRGELKVLERLFKHEPFKKLYLERLAEFNGTIFKPERFDKQVDAIAAVIHDSVKEESDVRFATFERMVLDVDKLGLPSTRPAQPNWGGGAPRNFGGNVKPIKQFVRPRHASVVAQVEGKENGVEIGNDFARNFTPQPPRQGGNGPGQFWGGQFVTWLDTDKDAALTAAELKAGFEKWFAAWDTEKKGTLTQDQFTAGLDRQLEAKPQRGLFDSWFGGGGNRDREQRGGGGERERR